MDFGFRIILINFSAQSLQCKYPGCTSTGQFKRHTDLRRHIKTQHEADQHREDCPHKWCGRVGAHGFTRRDHMREHLREVHRMEIPYRSPRKNPTSTSKTTRRPADSNSNGNDKNDYDLLDASWPSYN
jgi:hypothetical protein